MDWLKLALALAGLVSQFLKWVSEQQTRSDEDRKIAADAQKDIADAISKASAARAAVTPASGDELRNRDAADRRD